MLLHICNKNKGMRRSGIKQNNISSGVDPKFIENNIRCLLCLVHCHMVDPAMIKVLSGCHMSVVAIAVGDCIGGRRLVEAVVWLGTSTGEVSSLTTIEAPPVRRVLHWPLNSLLPLRILTSWDSSLGGIGALYELALRSLVALHCSLGSLLELSYGLLLGSLLDRSDRWLTYLGAGVVATLTLALLLPLALHETMVVF
jgi:hypothetical protein